MAEENIIAIIQARMGSHRFFGKTMYELAGKPSIEHLLDSVTYILPCSSVFVATSIDPANDILETFVERYGVHIFRGNENNVAGRFLDIIEAKSPDYFIRLNADSPLLDYRIIMKALEMLTESNADIVTTVTKPSFPSGMNVEVIRSKTFQDAYQQFEDVAHFEHVTRFFYENQNSYIIEKLSCPVPDAANCKFSFDTPEDAERLELFFNALQAPHYTYSLEQKCEIFRSLFGSV